MVYVNHSNNKAIVHDTGCGKYRARRRGETINGYRSSAFEDLDKAMGFAKSTGKSRVDTSFCIK